MRDKACNEFSFDVRTPAVLQMRMIRKGVVSMRVVSEVPTESV